MKLLRDKQKREDARKEFEDEVMCVERARLDLERDKIQVERNKLEKGEGSSQGSPRGKDPFSMLDTINLLDDNE